MINAEEQSLGHFYKIYTVPRKSLIKHMQRALKRNYSKYVESYYRKTHIIKKSYSIFFLKKEMILNLWENSVINTVAHSPPCVWDSLRP